MICETAVPSAGLAYPVSVLAYPMSVLAYPMSVLAYPMSVLAVLFLCDGCRRYLEYMFDGRRTKKEKLDGEVGTVELGEKGKCCVTYRM